MIWSTLKRRRTTILVSLVTVLATVALITVMMPVTYRSHATLLVETSQTASDESVLSVLERVVRANTLETEMELIRSRRVMEPVVEGLLYNVAVESDDRDGSAHPNEFFAQVMGSRDAVPGAYVVGRNPDGGLTVRNDGSDEILARTDADEEALVFAGIELSQPREEFDEVTVSIAPFAPTVSMARSRVSAQPIQHEANLVQISCSGSTPNSAQTLCLAVSDSYLALRSELQQSEATAAAAFLAEQVDEVGQRLTEAENALGEYQRSNQAVALGDRASSEVMQSAQLRAQIEQLEAERRALSDMINQTGAFEDLASFPTFLRSENQVVGGLVQTLVELQNQRSELAVTRTDRNPDIVAIDNRINEIENQLRSFAVNYERALGDQISSLSGAASRSSGRLTEIPMKQVETARLERQVRLLEDVYSFLQARLREAEVAKVVNLPSVRFVDEASIPTRQESPRVKLNLALGLLFGLGFGVVMAFYRERTDSRIREQGEVERETGIPVLTMVPKVKKPGAILPIYVETGEDGNGHRTLTKPGREEAGMPSRISWEQEVVLESFRSLATDLEFLGERLDQDHIRSVAITSSGRGDGKTFTACNLAIARAGRGARTLLIDADVRASGVARFFGLPWTTPGLTDVLCGASELVPAITSMQVADKKGALSVLTAGNPKHRSTGMLGTFSEVLNEVLYFATSNYDFVIVDTPPLNVLTDAASIATRVDGVVVVVRGEYTDKAALELTLKRLDRARAPILGLVLNDVELPEYYTSYSHDFTEEAR